MTSRNLSIIFLFLFITVLNAGNSKNYNDSLFFNTIKRIDTTPIKNQYKTNTCWSYSVLGMLESVMIKQSKEDISLSEMYIVYYTYIAKAERFVRMHGKSNFSGGGALNDPFIVINKYGIVPNEVYNGLPDGALNHDHIAMDAELKAYVEAVIHENPINPEWKNEFIEILNKYLGIPPTAFTFNGKNYTPASYAKSLNINFDDFTVLSSFAYKPYYCRFVIEVPDNWSFGLAFNLPLDELIAVIDNVLEQGCPVAITGDITEKGFKWNKGLATIVSDENSLEPDITAEMRQKAFDIHETTDDHGMLITGFGKDKFDQKYYLVKNSWGTEGTEHKGYIYMSEPYLKYKTITVVINKNLIPQNIFNKLNHSCIE